MPDPTRITIRSTPNTITKIRRDANQARLSLGEFLTKLTNNDKMEYLCLDAELYRAVMIPLRQIRNYFAAENTSPSEKKVAAAAVEEIVRKVSKTCQL